MSQAGGIAFNSYSSGAALSYHTGVDSHQLGVFADIRLPSNLTGLVTSTVAQYNATWIETNTFYWSTTKNQSYVISAGIALGRVSGVYCSVEQKPNGLDWTWSVNLRVRANGTTYWANVRTLNISATRLGGPFVGGVFSVPQTGILFERFGAHSITPIARADLAFGPQNLLPFTDPNLVSAMVSKSTAVSTSVRNLTFSSGESVTALLLNSTNGKASLQFDRISPRIRLVPDVRYTHVVDYAIAFKNSTTISFNYSLFASNGVRWSSSNNVCSAASNLTDFGKRSCSTSTIYSSEDAAHVGYSYQIDFARNTLPTTFYFADMYLSRAYSANETATMFSFFSNAPPAFTPTWNSPINFDGRYVNLGTRLGTRLDKFGGYSVFLDVSKLQSINFPAYLPMFEGTSAWTVEFLFSTTNSVITPIFLKAGLNSSRSFISLTVTNRTIFELSRGTDISNSSLIASVTVIGNSSQSFHHIVCGYDNFTGLFLAINGKNGTISTSLSLGVLDSEFVIGANDPVSSRIVASNNGTFAIDSLAFYNVSLPSNLILEHAIASGTVPNGTAVAPVSTPILSQSPSEFVDPPLDAQSELCPPLLNPAGLTCIGVAWHAPILIINQDFTLPPGAILEIDQALVINPNASLALESSSSVLVGGNLTLGSRAGLTLDDSGAQLKVRGCILFGGILTVQITEKTPLNGTLKIAEYSCREGEFSEVRFSLSATLKDICPITSKPTYAATFVQVAYTLETCQVTESWRMSMALGLLTTTAFLLAITP